MYRLTTAEHGVVFDINANGLPKRVAWTTPDTGSAWLALDRNRNGVIDSGAELFGNATRKRDGSLAANGYEALIDLDGGPEQSDGVLDRRDAVFSSLLLWFDSNHNGSSEPDELVRLVDAGVTGIALGYREVGRRDSNGNLFRYVGRAMVSRRGVEFERKIFDVQLVER